MCSRPNKCICDNVEEYCTNMGLGPEDSIKCPCGEVYYLRPVDTYEIVKE